MKITFLGTGPSLRIPRRGCGKWYVCKEARKPGSKSARLQSSAFFEFPRFNVLIDATQDFKKQLKLISGKKIDYVFLTHGHSDAAGGLPELTRFVKQTEMPEIIYTEKKVLKVASEEMLSIDLPLHHLTPYKAIDFKDFKLIPFRVEHAFNPKFPTLGYLFIAGRKKIVYVSDFKKIPIKSKKLIKGADLVILDCAAYKRPIPTHVSFPEILKLIKELKFKKVYLTQIGIAWPHYELAQKIVKKQAKNIFLAYDGLKITF
jgi:phosphoribosyl 1,2-cyclic phosphodiesterase